MARKPKLPDTQNTEGTDDGRKGEVPQEADASALTQAPAAEDATSAAEVAAPFVPDTKPLADGVVADGMVSVWCHNPAGRRRAGRRWSPGETVVPVAELLPYELAMLQGDPQFTVKLG